MRTAAERFEQLMEIVDDLRERSLQVPIVVEGSKDVISLEALGIGGEIIVLNKGLSIINFAELQLGRYDEVIILTDWDRTGGRLARALGEDLEANGMKFNLDIRKRLSRLCRKDIKDVEGLAVYYDRLQAEVAREKA